MPWRAAVLTSTPAWVGSMADRPPASDRLPSPVAAMLIIAFGVGLLIAVPSRAQRIAQVELVMVAVAAMRIIVLRTNESSATDVDAPGSAPRWTPTRSRGAHSARRVWARISPFSRRPAATRFQASAAPGGPIPDHMLRLGRHVHLMTTSDFNTVVHLRPTMLRLLEQAPAAATDPAVARVLSLGSAWEASRDSGGLCAADLDQVLSAFERHFAR